MTTIQATYTLSDNGFNILAGVELIAFGRKVHSWSLPVGAASITFGVSGWSLCMTYFEFRNVDKRTRRAKVGCSNYRQKKFVTPLRPAQAVQLLNGETTPTQVTERFHNV